MDLTICNETCAIKVQQFGRTLKSFISEGTGKSIARHCWNSVQMSLSHREITLYDCGPACEYRIPSLCQCSFTLEIYSKYKKSITDLRSEMTTGEVRGGGRKPPDSPLVKCESGRFSKAIIENIVIGQHWRLLGVEEVKDVPCRKSSTRPPSDFRVPPETWCRCNNLDRNKQRQDCDHENVECWREFWVGREKRVERVSPAEVISAAAIANDEFDQKSWQRMLLGLNLNELVERAASSEERTEELR
ncbi:hypothetical protein BCR37DRAFT_380713 [Protomyces lactucae-debilis]|uniref:Uncharacterized protein n=1 Tax=Protomyces lactucae-debilis TaxID=2754530 RepID=A0A1Y2FAF4_PROLT|nr:uncharacterized protein BCR37DRAFT_380713 [Protomyces lactucae-debilis]ORY80863.1 hypothetical protein BCR37DRAFT_380713 [Protomyces lactucae-debilis]